MSMLRNAAAALAFLSLSSVFAAAQEPAPEGALPALTSQGVPYRLSNRDTRAGFRAATVDGALMQERAYVAQGCIPRLNMQVTVPMRLAVEIGQRGKPNLGTAERRRFFSYMESRMDDMLAEMSMHPQMPQIIASGQGNAILLTRMSDFASGIGAVMGLKGRRMVMDFTDALILAEGCQRLAQENFAAARETFARNMAQMRQKQLGSANPTRRAPARKPLPGGVLGPI